MLKATLVGTLVLIVAVAGLVGLIVAFASFIEPTELSPALSIDVPWPTASAQENAPSLLRTRVYSPLPQPLPGVPITRPFRLPILEYHHIGEDTPREPVRGLVLSPQQFEAELAYLRCSGFTGITVSQLFDAIAGQGTLPPKPVILTFDDGFESQFKTAFPLLRRYGFPGSFALISSAPGSSALYMPWDQVQAMTAAGMEVMSHTVTHADLGVVDEARARMEVTDSRQALQRETGQPVDFFVYPSGEPFRSHKAREQLIVQMLRDAGYRGALLGGPASADQDPAKPYQMNRIEVLRGERLDDLAYSVGGPVPGTSACPSPPAVTPAG